jgi:rhamnulokinase
MSSYVAAVDLGATSGRVIVGSVGPNSLEIRALSRFPNTPLRAPDGLHWNIAELQNEVFDGLRNAFQNFNIQSIGVDSWAIDYGFIANKELLGVPFHYRDERSNFGAKQVLEKVSQEELFRINGLQYLPFNTIFQLAAEPPEGNKPKADTLLLIPDLMNFLLTGKKYAEKTNASTTGLVNINTGNWDPRLLEIAKVPSALMPEIIDPGTLVGNLTTEAEASLGGKCEVVAVGSHDTASAVVAVPMEPSTSVYISCGTWALVGTETTSPILSQEAMKANFTNEGGVDGRNRFLKNVMGLWILNETIREWKDEGQDVDLPKLLSQAADYEGAVSLFDVNDPVFLTQGDMPSRIHKVIEKNNQPVPLNPVEITKSIIESLAYAFTETAIKAADLSGVNLQVIHIVGGGALNSLLCQRVSERSGLPVVAGPVEATAIGNVLIQARTQKIISGDLEGLRHLVKSAFPATKFIPALRGI